MKLRKVIERRLPFILTLPANSAVCSGPAVGDSPRSEGDVVEISKVVRHRDGTQFLKLAWADGWLYDRDSSGSPTLVEVDGGRPRFHSLYLSLSLSFLSLISLSTLSLSFLSLSLISLSCSVSQSQILAFTRLGGLTVTS